MITNPYKQIGLLILSLLLITKFIQVNTARTFSEDNEQSPDIFNSFHSTDKYESIKDDFQELFNDAKNTLSQWKNTLGDKWEHFTKSLLFKKDETHSSLEDITHDFEKFQKVFDKGIKCSESTQEKLSGLLTDLQDRYNDLKMAFKEKYEDWKESTRYNSHSSIVSLIYDQAQRRYSHSKQRLEDELEALRTNTSENDNQKGTIFGKMTNALVHEFENINQDFANATAERLKRYEMAAKKAHSKRDQIYQMIKESVTGPESSAVTSKHPADQDFEALKQKIDSSAKMDVDFVDEM